MTQAHSDISVATTGASRGQGWKMVAAFLDDWVNPIVIKELRQAVRSRFIMAVLNLILIVQVCIVAYFLLSATSLTDFSIGPLLFMTLQSLLVISCILFVPAYVGVRFAAERSIQNVDLLYTTTIRPVSIIWGKFLSGAVVTGLIFSTTAPFMVLTYLLRGIDVPTILMILGMDFIAVLGAIQFAILAMAATNTVFSRGGVMILCLIVYAYVLAGTMGFAYAAVFGFGRSTTDLSEIWLPALAFIGANIALHTVMIIASAAVISPPSSNRALPMRAALTIFWFIGGCLAAGVSAYYNDLTPLQLWTYTSMIFFTFTLLIAICERDKPGPRVQAAIPRNPALRPLAFIFYSGSAGGAIWSLGLATLSGLIGFGLMNFRVLTHQGIDAAKMETFISNISLCAYIIGYALTAVLIVRYLGRGKLKTDTTFGITIALMAMGSILPPLVRLFIDLEHWDRGLWWRIGNPYAASIDTTSRTLIFILSVTWALVSMVLCLPWIFSQIKAFVPFTPRPVHETPSVATQTDVNPPESLS